MKARYAIRFDELRRLAQRVRILQRIRPNVLAAPLYRFVLPGNRRGIVMVEESSSPTLIQYQVSVGQLSPGPL